MYVGHLEIKNIAKVISLTLISDIKKSVMFYARFNILVDVKNYFENLSVNVIQHFLPEAVMPYFVK